MLNLYLSRYLIKKNGTYMLCRIIQYYFYTALNCGLLGEDLIGVWRSSAVRLLPMCLVNGRVCTARGRMPHDLPIASLWSAVEAVACCLKYWHGFVFHCFFFCLLDFYIFTLCMSLFPVFTTCVQNWGQPMPYLIEGKLYFMNYYFGWLLKWSLSLSTCRNFVFLT